MPEINLEVEQANDIDLDIDKPSSIILDSGEAVQLNENRDYDKLKNKPKINGEEVKGHKTLEDFGESTITYQEIRNVVDNAVKFIFGQ